MCYFMVKEVALYVEVMFFIGKSVERKGKRVRDFLYFMKREKEIRLFEGVFLCWNYGEDWFATRVGYLVKIFDACKRKRYNFNKLSTPNDH